MSRATDNGLKHYDEHGLFIREDVLSEKELVAMREGAESAHAQFIRAAVLPESESIDKVDNQRYQSVLGSAINWENGTEDFQSLVSTLTCLDDATTKNGYHCDPR